MSYYDYKISRDLIAQDIPFAALVMAADAKADMLNSALLRAAFPEITDEARARYYSPGGLLPDEIAART